MADFKDVQKGTFTELRRNDKDDNTLESYFSGVRKPEAKHRVPTIIKATYFILMNIFHWPVCFPVRSEKVRGSHSTPFTLSPSSLFT